MFIKKIFFFLYKKISNFEYEKKKFNKMNKKKYENIFNNLKKKKEEYQLIKTHKNNVFLIYLPKKKIFRKYSVEKNGIKKIEAERNALKWYYKKLKKKNNIVNEYYFNSNLIAIDLKIIKGKKIKSWESLKKNFKFLIVILNHYKKIFERKDKIFIHGDLTLDNVIFFKKKVARLIDWEFFGAKKKLWGYDIAYLFLSSVTIPYISQKKISKKDIYLFKKLWSILCKLKINQKILKDPFNFFEKEINNDKILNQALNISKKKFFPLITPKKIKKEITKICNQVL